MEFVTVEFKPGSREELQPDFNESFPHIITQASFREGVSAPWHWHQAVELFYIESGTLEYITPGGQHLFHAGSGGFVNSNVLHATKGHQIRPGDGHLLHLFDPVLISGSPGSRIEETYVLPLTTAPELELLAWSRGNPGRIEF